MPAFSHQYASHKLSAEGKNPKTLPLCNTNPFNSLGALGTSKAPVKLRGAIHTDRQLDRLLSEVLEKENQTSCKSEPQEVSDGRPQRG